MTSAESDASRYRDQYQSERDRNFTRMQDIESERVTLRTENAILSEKLTQAKLEIEDLRKKQSNISSEKLLGLESECTRAKEEARTKEAKI